MFVINDPPDWYTVDDACNKGGPHFDYLFFTVYTAIIAQIFGAVGIWCFNKYFSRLRMRKAGGSSRTSIRTEIGRARLTYLQRDCS